VFPLAFAGLNFITGIPESAQSVGAIGLGLKGGRLIAGLVSICWVMLECAQTQSQFVALGSKFAHGFAPWS
jgi:hypothetical protein